MKKAILFVVLCAALFASCSQLQTGGGTATVNINSKQLLDRARNVFDDSGSVDQVAVEFILFVNGEKRELKTTVANMQSNTKVFSFGNIPLGATVEIYCIAYDPGSLSPGERPYTSWCKGGTTTITVGSGAENITLDMRNLTNNDPNAAALFQSVFGLE